jgi:hypothetical protein
MCEYVVETDGGAGAGGDGEKTMMERDVRLPDGRSLHVYDAGGDGFPVVWHHGTPNLGAPPAPLFPVAERLGLR